MWILFPVVSSDVITYKLCSYPLSSFESVDAMRVPEQPQITEEILDLVSNTANSESIETFMEHRIDQYVLGGESYYIICHMIKLPTTTIILQLESRAGL